MVLLFKHFTFSYFNYSLYSVVYGIGVTLIQPLDYSAFFDREKVYGYSDDFERSVEYIYFFFQQILNQCGLTLGCIWCYACLMIIELSNLSMKF